MPRILRILGVFLAAALLSSCDAGDPESGADVRTLSQTEERLVEADNDFGLSLFRDISSRAPDENVFISPLSVSMALGMTLNGAAGETRAAMEQTLALEGLSREEINRSYESLIALLSELDPQVAFQIANSIWYRDTFTVEQDFIDTNSRYFDAEVQAADFASPEAVERINGWVDEKTQGRIEEIIGSINADVVMYLINAIYFKGTWTYEFDEEATTVAPFHAPGPDAVEVPLMTTQAELPYLETDGLQVVDLPYGDRKYSMTILLPKPGNAVDELVTSLDRSRWEDLTQQLAETDALVYLPKFKLEYKTGLRDVLSAMGMQVAFSNQADFSAINPTHPLAISRVLHKTFLEVDEAGTEAAAVTAVEVTLTSAGPRAGAVVRVDRPFVLVIREQHSGTILFVGKIANPAS